MIEESEGQKSENRSQVNHPDLKRDLPKRGQKGIRDLIKGVHDAIIRIHRKPGENNPDHEEEIKDLKDHAEKEG